MNTLLLLAILRINTKGIFITLVSEGTQNHPIAQFLMQLKLLKPEFLAYVFFSFFLIISLFALQMDSHAVAGCQTIDLL